PGIGRQKQTFEELLEEQLQLEEQRLKSVQQQQVGQFNKTPPKRAFLKRGQGLSRFTNNRKASLPKMEVDSQPQPQARVISCSNSAPASIQKGGINGVQRLPVQRKTAVLNKENRLRSSILPSQDTRVESKAAWTKILGSQRQNTEVPLSVQTDPEGRQTKQHQQSDAPKEKNCGSRVESAEGKTGSDGGGAEGDGVPQDTFELSFQEKLQHWECERHLESVELGEFELLEQAAEELSFSSNSSFVMKFLQMDQQQRQLQAARGLHQGRLSSTPIKSPPKEVLQRPSSVDSGDDLLCKSSSVTLEAFVAKVGYDPLKNKVSIEDKEKQDSDVSSCGGSEFEDQEVAVKPPSFPSTICFPAQSNPPYDKRSYQDDDVCRGSASDVTQGDDDSDGVLSNGDESTLIEEKDGPQGRVVFDDDDTWNDLEDPPVGPPSRGFSPVSKASGISHPEQTLLGKVPVSKFVELDKDTVTSSAKLKLDPPPASQLMTKLFPSLKLGAQSAPLPSPLASVAPESKRSEGDTGETNTCRFLSITCISQQVQSRQLRERLAELEIEIERFKKENATLARLRQENEKKQEDLSKERLEFEQVKAEEMAKFEEYKKEENRKLQKERKLFEKHASAARAMPDKKEREEIQALKQQLSSLQEELRRKESRWASTRGRLRQQIDSLSQENSSLRNEVFTPFTLGIKIEPLPTGAERSEAEKPESAQEVITHPDGKIEKVLASGERLTIFPNGTTKEVSADGLMVKVTFFNGDTKQITADQRVIYYYADAQTIHITYPDGMEVLHFPNNQTEKHFPDGRKEITFPDQTVKSLFPDGREESVLTDGTIIQVNPDGTKEIHFNTGQKEIHTADYKRREYPDGTVKTVYNDGRQETRYPNGQLRIKDKDGNITLDNSLEPLSLNK
uniref:Centromere protein J n=1 Tax=Monopterus albus TaxID=43700 RepID=A0A3Q3R1Q7_MONAL